MNETKKRLMPSLYILSIVAFMALFGYLMLKSYINSNVVNPEVFSLPQVGRKVLLNSGNSITNLRVSLPDPWLNGFVQNSHPVSFTIQFLIPMLAFGYLLFLAEMVSIER